MSTGHSAPSTTKPRIASTMGKARILFEAMEYIKAYRDTVVVIKYGGSAMVHEELRDTFAADVALLHLVGLRPVIVHGGGHQITAAADRQGLEATWVDGLRVTDAEMLRVVQTTLAGEINPAVVHDLNEHGAVAVGMTGLDGHLFAAEPLDTRLGFVGDIGAVNTVAIRRVIEAGYIPVVAPLARGPRGGIYNVNADTAAGALAAALGAEKLVFLTDVPGLLADSTDPESLISKIYVGDVDEALRSGTVTAGMIPKLQAAVGALRAGVRRSHLLDGRLQHSILLEIFTPEGIGTMIVPDGDST